MRILVIISILALAAVLWAGISIIQHIRTSRRRRKILRTKEPSLIDGTLGLSNPAPMRILPKSGTIHAPAPQSEFAQQAFAALAPPPAPKIVEPAIPPSIAPRIAALVAILDAAVAEPVATIVPPVPKTPERIVAPPKVEVVAGPLPELSITEYIPEPVAEPTPALIAKPVLSTPDILITEALAEPEIAPAISETTPSRRPPTRSIPTETDIIHQPAALAAAEPGTDARRPVRSVHPQPSTPFALPTRRPDWAYFNKDMGDLSDPVPSRIRDRRANSR